MAVSGPVDLQRQLAAWVDVIRVRAARRSVIRYGHNRLKQRVLAVDPSILTDPEAGAALSAWLASRGRIRGPLRDLISRCESRQIIEPPFLLPASGVVPDLDARLRIIHPAAAPGTPMPEIRWGRATRGRLRSIRFGSYHRLDALIRIHPRLARPWVADLFVDAVIHHELCHHRQACAPIRGERTHSARFRAWDRAFPGHSDAERWMRSHLARLLSDE